MELEALAGTAEAVLAAMPMPICRHDAAHRVVWANAAARALYGRLPVGETAAPSGDGAGDWPARQKALGGEPSCWEGWARYPTGPCYTARHFLPLNGDGRAVGYIEIVIDLTAQATAREAAARAEALLRDAIESLPHPVGIQDAHGVLKVCNDAYRRLYGLPAEALVGVPFAARFPVLVAQLRAVDGQPLDPADPEAVARLTRHAAGTMAPLAFTLADGRDLLVRRAHTAEGGRVVVMTDVTALNERARDADAARALLEHAIGSLDFGFALFDADGALSLWNAAFASMVGSARACRGASWEAMLADGTAAGDITPAEEDPAAPPAPGGRGRDRRHEIEYDLADGRRIAAALQPMPDAGTVLTLRDVSARRLREAALHRSWAVLRSVMDLCPTPITMARASDGEVVYINPATRELMRVAPMNPRPPGVSTVAYWDPPEGREAYVAALREHGRVDGYEHGFKRGDGSRIWLGMWSRLVEFEGEMMIVTTSADMTEKRAQEAERARQREIAHQAEKLAALGELLAGVSHELNNPLSVLVGQAAILRETAPDASVRQRAERLAEAADRCARIVRSFLAMARQSPLRPGPVLLEPLVAEALSAAASEIVAAEATVTLSLAPGLPPLRGDADQLRQLLVNLIGNAAQAMRGIAGPRKISVTATQGKTAGQVRLSVRDTGPGVPLAIASRIFEPLFTTKHGAGAGIGLALCHRIASAHGGRIALAQESAGGACFVVDLPVEAAAPTGEPERAPHAGPTGLQVLLVDDDAEVLRTGAELLALDGHRPICAGSAREALRLLGDATPDIILSDVRMPDIDGIGLFGRVLVRHPELVGRFAFLSGDTLGSEVARRLRETGRPCLEKPFLPDDLRGMIATLMADGVARREPGRGIGHDGTAAHRDR